MKGYFNRADPWGKSPQIASNFRRADKVCGEEAERTHAGRSKASLARPEGLEPPRSKFEACRSVQLSYGRSLLVYHGTTVALVWLQAARSVPRD